MWIDKLSEGEIGPVPCPLPLGGWANAMYPGSTCLSPSRPQLPQSKQPLINNVSGKNWDLRLKASYLGYRSGGQLWSPRLSNIILIAFFYWANVTSLVLSCTMFKSQRGMMSHLAGSGSSPKLPKEKGTGSWSGWIMWAREWEAGDVVHVRMTVAEQQELVDRQRRGLGADCWAKAARLRMTNVKCILSSMESGFYSHIHAHQEKQKGHLGEEGETEGEEEPGVDNSE